MAYLMGIDLGTSSLKVIIIDDQGNLKVQTAQGYRFDSPEVGFAEQDVSVWWQACCNAVRQAVELLGAPASEIKAVSFSGQMHGQSFWTASCSLCARRSCTAMPDPPSR